MWARVDQQEQGEMRSPWEAALDFMCASVCARTHMHVCPSLPKMGRSPDCPFSSVGQALWVPKDSEVKWDSLVSKVSWGRGRESKDSVETSHSRGKSGFRAQRDLMDMTHKLRSARGGGETKMDGKLSSEPGTDPSWSSPHELPHQGICFPCR